MSTEVTLPALGESVTEGTVSRWLKQVGDTIEADEALLEVSTDKVDTEIPSPAAGTLLEIKVSEDETVEVGAVLAVIGEPSDDTADGDSPDDNSSDDNSSDDNSSADGGTAASSESGSGDDSGGEVDEQADAGDEGGQQPIPAEPRTESPKAEAPTGDAPKAETPKSETPKSETPKSEAPKSEAPKSETSPPAAAPRATGDSSEPYVTPLVRKLAEQHGVELASITGTGVGGRIRKQDILAAAEAATKAAEEAKQAEASQAPAAPAASAPSTGAAAPSPEAVKLRGTTQKLSRQRKVIAQRMTESLRVAAQLTATVEVDLTRVSRLRARVKENFARTEGVKLSYLPFITKAAVETLKAHPKVNAQIDTEAGEVTYADAEHIGIAVDTEKGLIVPVIRNAGDLNLAGIAKQIGDIANRSRTNKLTPDDLAGGTFTITNYGSAGTLLDTPILNQPQVGILGTGAMVKRPVVISDPDLGDTIAVRDMMYLSLTYDHRLVDGADAARFLSALKARLEEGDFDAEFGL